MGKIMRYAGLNKNDFSAAPGVSVSFFLQGCPHRCKGCHNPETWDFNGGKEFTPKVLDEICEALAANDVNRSLSIMGGEPLCQENLFLTYLVISTIKKHSPKTKVYIWTGYYYRDLMARSDNRTHQILELTDVLIDGPYIESRRDVSLPMRGSSNQSIINLKEKRNG